MAKYNPKLAQRVREVVKKWDDWWKYNNDTYHEYTSFILGNQWRDDEAKLFETYKKIPLTFNKIAPLANNVIADFMQRTPNLQIEPGKGVSAQDAEVRGALIKDISLNSHAKEVYQVCFGQMVIGGFSAYGVGTKYSSKNGFEQDPEFFSIKDPTRCFWDINAETPCKTDGLYCGVRKKLSRKLFRKRYGKKIEQSIGSSATEDGMLSFSTDDSITVVEIYEREYDFYTIYQLSNGEVVDSMDDLQKVEIDIDDEDMEGWYSYRGEIVRIVNSRSVDRYKVMHRQIAGDYELDSEEYPTEQLPIIFVDQFSYYDKQGRQICRPAFKDAKDAQRYLNYLKTQSAYIMKVSRYDQFMASKQNVKGNDTQQMWRDPGTMQGALLYDESPNGNKPERLDPPQLSPSLIQQYDSAILDIHTSTGMYESQLGQQGNEISGDAIDARRKSGNKNTYIPFNSIDRAILVGGEIVNEMIPRLYDTERTLNLNMPQSGMRQVTINRTVDEYGSKELDMTKGEYKIRLVPGPSYEGQMEENLQSLANVLNADKSGQVFPMVADLYVDNLPMSNKIEVRNRLRAALVPPEIIEAGKTGKPMPPKQAQPDPAIMLKMQELEVKKQDVERKQQELQLKAMQTHQDMTLEWEKLEAEKEEAAARLKEMELRYQAETHRTLVDENIAHADNLVKILTHTTKGNRHEQNEQY